MSSNQRILGFCGWSGSGKTFLITQLIPNLIEKGLKVSSMKRTHHNVNLDPNPKKDSSKHRDAGSHEVILSSSARFAITHELNGEQEPSPNELARQLQPVDLVIAEGFKAFDHVKMEVYRKGDKSPLILGEQVTNIQAIVADDVDHVKSLLGDRDLPVFDMEDINTLAEYIMNDLSRYE